MSPRPAHAEPPWRHLDPGIREAVRLLWDAGFTPTDSGDGVSKPEAGIVFPFPHVVCLLPDGADMRAECCRALELDYGALSLEQTTPTICDVSFSAIDQKAVLFVGWPPQEPR